MRELEEISKRERLLGKGSDLTSIHSFGFRNALINRLAASETFLRSVPMRDGFLSQLPAQQDRLPLDFAGEIEQAHIQVFYLYTDRINLGQGVFSLLLGLGTLGAPAGHRNNVNECSAIEKDAMLKRLQLALGFLDRLLGVDRRAQQRFEHWQQRLGFIESECTVRHAI